MKRNELVKTIIIMASIVVITVVSSILLNLITGPIIEANKSGAANEALAVVMPDNNGFEQLYDAANPTATTLTVLPTTVVATGDCSDGTSGQITAIYKEKSGKGFVFTFEMTTNFSKSPMQYTVGVNADGTICGIKENVYTDSKVVGADFVSSFISQDSALSGVQLVGGVTYSSKAIVAAVSAGLNVLIDNSLITAGVKSDAQILEELISTVISSFKKSDAALSIGGSISAAYRLANDAGFAYIMTKGEATYLVICNNFNVCKVFTYTTDETSGEVSLVDVTAEHADLVTEATAHASQNTNSQVEKAIKKFKSMSKSEDVVALTNLDVFNTVVAVTEITIDGSKYYGFYSRSYGFEDMNVYVILDAEGKIYKVEAEKLVFEETYFYFNDKGIKFEGIPTNYLENMVGVGNETFTEDLTVITAATMTSKSMAQSLKDAFAAYAVIQGGNE